MRNSIKLDGIAEAWLNHEPKTKAITADDLSKAIEWARVHIHINSDSLQAAIDRIYGDGFVLGKDMAMQEMTGVVLTDWDKWKPGNRAAAELVRRNNGLLSLINNSSQVISGLNTTTYNRLGRVLAETLAEGKSGRATAKRITEELGHIIDDPARALTIAVTETRRAVSTASAQAYAATGVKQVSWLIAEGEGLCDDCRGNNEESPIALGDTFPSGDYAPPAHPNCRCALQPNVDELMTQDEFEAAFANYDEEINLAIVPTLVKYDENQPRDEHGRWTSDSDAPITLEQFKAEDDRLQKEIEERARALPLEWWREYLNETSFGGDYFSNMSDESLEMARDNYIEHHLSVAGYITQNIAIFGYDRNLANVERDAAIKLMGVSEEVYDRSVAIAKSEIELPNGKTFTFQEAVDKYVVADTPTIKMNSGLRAGRESSEKSQLCQLTDWTTSQLAIQQPIEVSRSTVLPAEIHEQLAVGSIFTDKGFQSTTFSSTGTFYAEARRSDGAQGDIVLNHIYLPEGQQVGVFQGREIVLPRNTTMEVTDRHIDENGVIHIYTRVVK